MISATPSIARTTSNPVAKANSLEESIIRSLNQKYKDFRVVDDGDEDEDADPKHLPWQATNNWPAPRRSQSWLCCPTIYKTSASDRAAGFGVEPSCNNVDRKILKDDSITVAPRLNRDNFCVVPNAPHPVQLQTQTCTALSTMRSEVVELSQRLQRSEHSRHVLEQQLRDTLQDRERTHRQLESLAATHESRITEMHCVIVELSKKLKTKEDGAIAEEPEGSGE